MQDWPDWLEQHRLDDEYAAAAYEETTPEQRARLKTAIAMHFSLHAPTSGVEEIRRSSWPHGFACQIYRRPVSWLVALIDPTHDAPARLLAALLPAILAGVEHIIVLCPGGKPSPGNCVALELAGLEHIFVFPPEPREQEFVAFGPLLDLLGAGEKPGRLLLFPSFSSTSHWMALKQDVQEAGLRIWEDSLPHVTILEGEPLAQQEQKAFIQWSHGQACPIAPWKPECILPQAWYLPEGSELPAFFLPAKEGFIFGPGMESCWVHRNLDSHFFYASSHYLTVA